ncbi:hypothetical protein D3C84_869630 [compost metagenome]
MLWASRRALSSMAGACRTCSGTSSNTLHGCAPGTGANDWLTWSMPLALNSAALPARICAARAPACWPSTSSIFLLSSLPSRLCPASRPEGLTMLIWPLPSNSSRRPSRLSCCRLSRLMSRPITPITLPSCLSGMAILVISGVRSPTVSK